MARTRVDISNENFDHFFVSEAKKLTEQDKAKVPFDILFRIFKRTGEFRDLNQTTFLEKLIVLLSAYRKKIFFIIGDPSGLSPEEFLEFNKKGKKATFDKSPVSGWLIKDVNFCLASPDLVKTMELLNSASVGSLYNYLIKEKNSPIVNNVKEWEKQTKYVFRQLYHYEAIKKRMLLNYSMGVPEWFVLMYVAVNEETVSSIMHKEVFKNTFNSSVRKIKQAFGTLQGKGLVEKIGNKKTTKLRITPLGISTLQKMMKTYIVNC